MKKLMCLGIPKLVAGILLFGTFYLSFSQELSILKIENKVPVIVENLSPAVKPKVFTEYDLVLHKALSKQLMCDSMQAELLSYKNHLRITENIDERCILIASITATENQLAIEQLKADELFIKAQRLQESNKKEMIVEVVEDRTEGKPENIVVEKEIGDLKVYSYLPLVQNHDKKVEEITFGESLPIIRNRLFRIIGSFAVQEQGRDNELKTSEFKILTASPYTDKKPMPVDKALPEGLLYRIQLGAFGQKLPMNTFGGLSPVSAEIIEDQKITKYYVGYFISSKEARLALGDVKEYGYADAFIVPYYNSEKISIQAAREIEFGQKNRAK